MPFLRAFATLDFTVAMYSGSELSSWKPEPKEKITISKPVADICSIAESNTTCSEEVR